MAGKEKEYDVVIIGAGSGGIGAALSAGRLGLKVLLVEKSYEIGGNAAVSGVSVWEMGVGGTGIPFDIYKQLIKVKNASGIYSFNRHCTWKYKDGKSQFPAGADLTVDHSLGYRDSLRRYGAKSLAEDEDFVRKYWHGVVFEPKVYQDVVEKLIKDTGTITLLKNTSFQSVDFSKGLVQSITLSNGDSVSASYYIDATDSGYLCQACGFETLFGQESKKTFNEPDAPEIPTETINGVSLIYRIRPTQNDEIQQLPADIPQECWWRDSFPLTSMVQYPNGDYNVNMLPTMDGKEYMVLKREAAFKECQRRSLAHWHYLQTSFPEFQNYRRISEFMSLGVRETKRVIGEYILTEHDLLAGITRQKHLDVITLADHAMDLHGDERSGCTELSEPYGVPYRCLVPKGSKNMLVASRSASFSSLAASSCRLSRTIMQLGQAAGTAVFIAGNRQVNVMDVPSEDLRKELREQNVQLEWPIPRHLHEHIMNKKNCETWKTV